MEPQSRFRDLGREVDLFCSEFAIDPPLKQTFVKIHGAIKIPILFSIRPLPGTARQKKTAKLH
jgi:hypothetical protein